MLRRTLRLEPRRYCSGAADNGTLPDEQLGGPAKPSTQTYSGTSEERTRLGPAVLSFVERLSFVGGRTKKSSKHMITARGELLLALGTSLCIKNCY